MPQSIARNLTFLAVQQLDVCPCEPMPVNWWQMPTGEWIVGSEIGARGVAGADALAAEDAVRFNFLGCRAWVIKCPECGRVYAEGVA